MEGVERLDEREDTIIELVVPIVADDFDTVAEDVVKVASRLLKVLRLSPIGVCRETLYRVSGAHPTDTARALSLLQAGGCAVALRQGRVDRWNRWTITDLWFPAEVMPEFTGS